MAAPPDMRAPRDVTWEYKLSYSQPRWVSEPSLELIERLVRTRLSLPATVPCDVAFFAQGSFNKLYSVATPDRTFLLRVCLPVEPRWKTLSEVATIDHVRRTCTERVPEIVAFDADADGELAFEWILMSRLPGSVLEDQWASMSCDAKESLVRAVADVVAKLYDHPLAGIGNIYPEDDSADKTPTVGRIVAMEFFWDKHYDQDVPRGPFRSAHDWLAARLAFVHNDIDETLRTSHDEDDLEDAALSQALVRRLHALLPTLFPAELAAPEATVIHHDDLSFHNILVDARGSLTGIVDWECVSAVPLFHACQLPSFLLSRDRTDRPDPTTYVQQEDGAPDELYGIHLREWERTALRGVFVEHMERVRPAWLREYREGARKADFALAVQYCNDEIGRYKVKRWLDSLEEGAGGDVPGGVESVSLLSLMLI